MNDTWLDQVTRQAGVSVSRRGSFAPLGALALLANGVSSATAQGKRGKLDSTGKKPGKKKGKGQANALCARQEQQCRDTFLPLCQGDIVCLGQLGCCEELATCDVLGFFICLAPQ